MKTPMQELIDYLETWMLEDKHVQDNPMKYEEYMVHHANQMVQIKEHLIRLCKSMLEKEKEVIMDAYMAGESDATHKIDSALNYYNETFKPKEK